MVLRRYTQGCEVLEEKDLPQWGAIELYSALYDITLGLIPETHCLPLKQEVKKKDEQNGTLKLVVQVWQQSRGGKDKAGCHLKSHGSCLERYELLLSFAPHLQAPPGSFIALFWYSTHLNLVSRPHSPLKTPVIVAACLLILLQESDCHCNGNNTAKYIYCFFTVFCFLMPPGQRQRLYSFFRAVLGRPRLYLCGLGQSGNLN